MTQQRFENVEPAKFTEVKAALRAKGISVPEGNNGRITIPDPKILLDFNYDGSNVLDLTLVDKPWLVPEGMIWDKIASGLKA